MTFTASYAANLRRDLAQRAYAYAEARSLPYFLSLGASPAVIFTRGEDGLTHGNFHPPSFSRLLANESWARRLGKAHTSRKSLPVEHRDGICELDSSNSSDALLMNVMCFPCVLESSLSTLLRTGPDSDVRFGHQARIPFHSRADNTELDMVVGDLIVEAKLTEGDFGAQPLEKLERYRDLHKVFDVAALPKRRAPLNQADEEESFRVGASLGPTRELVDGYQLVRNVLAAHHLGMRFRLMCDERRPDLCEHLYDVLRAVRDGELRARCGMVTWQEVARRAPAPLQAFLEEKFGIA